MLIKRTVPLSTVNTVLICIKLNSNTCHYNIDIRVVIYIYVKLIKKTTIDVKYYMYIRRHA